MREALPVILLFLPILLALLLRLRPRQGALSARRTPTRPPAPARLVPLPGMVVMPEVDVPASAIDVGNMPRADRCPRESDWCDGRLCRERGINCPHADR